MAVQSNTGCNIYFLHEQIQTMVIGSQSAGKDKPVAQLEKIISTVHAILKSTDQLEFSIKGIHDKLIRIKSEFDSSALTESEFWTNIKEVGQVVQNLIGKKIETPVLAPAPSIANLKELEKESKSIDEIECMLNVKCDEIESALEKYTILTTSATLTNDQIKRVLQLIKDYIYNKKIQIHKWLKKADENTEKQISASEVYLGDYVSDLKAIDILIINYELLTHRFSPKRRDLFLNKLLGTLELVGLSFNDISNESPQYNDDDDAAFLTGDVKVSDPTESSTPTINLDEPLRSYAQSPVEADRHCYECLEKVSNLQYGQIEVFINIVIAQKLDKMELDYLAKHFYNKIDTAELKYLHEELDRLDLVARHHQFVQVDALKINFQKAYEKDLELFYVIKNIINDLTAYFEFLDKDTAFKELFKDAACEVFSNTIVMVKFKMNKLRRELEKSQGLFYDYTQKEVSKEVANAEALRTWDERPFNILPGGQFEPHIRPAAPEVVVPKKPGYHDYEGEGMALLAINQSLVFLPNELVQTVSEYFFEKNYIDRIFYKYEFDIRLLLLKRTIEDYIKECSLFPEEISQIINLNIIFVVLSEAQSSLKDEELSI